MYFGTSPDNGLISKERNGGKMAENKKNKKAPAILIMLAAAAVLGILYYVLYRMDLNAEPEDESNVVSIHSMSSDDLVSFTFTDASGSELTLVKEEGIWYIDSDRDFPVDANDVNDMVSSVSTLLSTRELDSDTGEYGFDEPQNVLTLKYSTDEGESVLKYTVGDENSFNSGTYLRDDVNGKIYICSTNPASSFEVERNDLIKLDLPASDVDVTSAHTVTINNGEGGINVITDTDGIEEFLGEPFGNVDCTDWVEYAADDSDMARYGITKAEDGAGVLVNYKTTVSVTDENGESTALRQEASYNIWFGDRTDDGDIYYTITDSTIVYKLSADKYDALMAYLSYTPPPETETSGVTDTTAAAE